MKRALLCIVLALLVILVAACSGASVVEDPFAESEASAPTPAPSPGQEPEPDWEPKVLRIAVGRCVIRKSESGTILHHSTNVWEALTKLDDEMEPALWLADSIEVSADGLTWTIRLRENIVFHDGSVLNAEAAAFNIERLLRYSSEPKVFDLEFGSFGAALELGSIIEIAVISEYVFTVTHEVPVSDFPARLALGNSAMFAMSSFDENGAIIHPYGTGPFVFAGYDESNHVMRLERFEEYYLGQANIDIIYFHYIPEPTVRLEALQGGAIDVIAGAGGVLPEQTDLILSDENLILRERQISIVHFLGLNSNEDALFGDWLMRSALSLAIDREGIVNTLLYGYGVPAISVINDLAARWVVDGGYWFHPWEVGPMVKAAHEDVVPGASLLVNTAWADRWPYEDVALILQSQLGEFGIDLVIESLDNETWNERVKNGEYDIIIHPAVVRSGEPIKFLTHFIESLGENHIAVSGLQLDELAARASIEMDFSIRREYIAELQQRLRWVSIIIPIWYEVTLYATNARVENFKLDINARPNLFAVEKT